MSLPLGDRRVPVSLTPVRVWGPGRARIHTSLGSPPTTDSVRRPQDPPVRALADPTRTSTRSTCVERGQRSTPPRPSRPRPSHSSRTQDSLFRRASDDTTRLPPTAPTGCYSGVLLSVPTATAGEGVEWRRPRRRERKDTGEGCTSYGSSNPVGSPSPHGSLGQDRLVPKGKGSGVTNQLPTSRSG